MIPSLTTVTAERPAAAATLIARLTPAVLPLAAEGICGMTIVDVVARPVIIPTSMSASVASDVAVVNVSSQRWAP